MFAYRLIVFLALASPFTLLLAAQQGTQQRHQSPSAPPLYSYPHAELSGLEPASYLQQDYRTGQHEVSRAEHLPYRSQPISAPIPIQRNQTRSRSESHTDEPHADESYFSPGLTEEEEGALNSFKLDHSQSTNDIVTFGKKLLQEAREEFERATLLLEEKLDEVAYESQKLASPSLTTRKVSLSMLDRLTGKTKADKLSKDFDKQVEHNAQLEKDTKQCLTPLMATVLSLKSIPTKLQTLTAHALEQTTLRQDKLQGRKKSAGALSSSPKGRSGSFSKNS